MILFKQLDLSMFEFHIALIVWNFNNAYLAENDN